MLFRMYNVTLPPDLECFAAELVAEVRYSDMSDVVCIGVALLPRAEAEPTAFMASLYEAEAEGERDGFFTMDEIAQEMYDIIEAKRQRR